MEKANWSTALYAIATVDGRCFYRRDDKLLFPDMAVRRGDKSCAGTSRRAVAKHCGIVVGTVAVVLIAAAFENSNTGSTRNSFRSRGWNRFDSLDLRLSAAATARGAGRDCTRERRAGWLGFPTRYTWCICRRLMFVSAWLVPGRRWQPDAVRCREDGGDLVSARSRYAFAIARLTEYRTDVVRTRE